MLDGLKKHFHHYFSLVAIFAFGLTGFYFFRYDNFFQTGLVVAMAVAYISWGIIHHIIHGDICITIILEYLAVSVLGTVILYMMLFRA